MNAQQQLTKAHRNAAQWLRRRIRGWLLLFIVCLVLSGLTAFPLVTELRILPDYPQRFGTHASVIEDAPE